MSDQDLLYHQCFYVFTLEIQVKELGIISTNKNNYYYASI